MEGRLLAHIPAACTQLAVKMAPWPPAAAENNTKLAAAAVERLHQPDSLEHEMVVGSEGLLQHLWQNNQRC